MTFKCISYALEKVNGHFSFFVGHFTDPGGPDLCHFNAPALLIIITSDLVNRNRVEEDGVV